METAPLLQILMVNQADMHTLLMQHRVATPNFHIQVARLFYLLSAVAMVEVHIMDMDHLMVMVEWVDQVAAVQATAMVIQDAMALAQLDKALLAVLAKVNITQAAEEVLVLLVVQDETLEMLLVA